MPDQKNLILAIVVSIVILVGFQFLYERPRVAQQQAAQTTAQTTETAPDTRSREVGSPVAPNQALEGIAEPSESPGRAAADRTAARPGAPLTRAEALQQTPRVRIDTPRVHGSLSLVGSRIDDLTLADYRETVDPRSPEIVLLSPRSAPSPYYADFGWIAAEPGVAVPGPDTLWTADSDVLTADKPVTLRWDNGAGLVFEKTVAIDANYMFTVTQRVVNNGGAPVALTPYGRVLRFGTPPTQGFYILHEGPYGVFDGTLREYSYKNMREDPSIAHHTTGGWLGFTDKYWLVSLIPDQQVPVDAQFTQRTESGEDRYFALYHAAAQTVAPGGTAEATDRLFAGAKEVALIDTYSSRLGIQHFDLAIDFGWFYFLTKPFFYILAYIHGLVGNFGIAILVFTVLVKAVFFPLANKSYKAMSRMKALQPEITKLRERFAEDRQKMNLEMMALYKREKVNPAAGCLPIMIQIPVFFALYKVLFVTIEMRHAPFFGWIKDLSAPDPTTIFNLFGLIPWQPPPFLMIGVWPLIMGITMYLQQKLNPAPADPVQQKVFMALPVVFTFMLAPFPAGLVIYWAWNNLLSIAQQWLIMRSMHVKIGGGVDKTAPQPAPSATRRKPANAGAGGGAEDGAAAAASAGERPRAERPKAEAAAAKAAAAATAPAEPAAAVRGDGDTARRKPAGGAAANRAQRRKGKGTTPT